MSRDIKYMKMPNYYRRDKEILEDVEVTEKLDGANFRWYFVSPDKIVYGSRNNWIASSDGGKILRDTGATLGDKGSGGTFTRFVEFVMKSTQGNTLPEDYMNLVFFGECIGGHKIGYKVEEDRLVMGFAVYDVEQHIWRKDWKQLHRMMGIPTVMVIEQFKHLTPQQIWDDIINDEEIVKKMKSWYDAVSRIEGVVIADYENQTFFKLKTKEFMEERMPKQKVSNWARFVDKYATTQRIEKIILKMQNEELGYNKKNPVMSLIGHLSKDVFEEADVNDIIKILRKELMPLFAQVVRNPEIMKIIMGLKE